MYPSLNCHWFALQYVESSYFYILFNNSLNYLLIASIGMLATCPLHSAALSVHDKCWSPATNLRLSRMWHMT